MTDAAIEIQHPDGTSGVGLEVLQQEKEWNRGQEAVVGRPVQKIGRILGRPVHPQALSKCDRFLEGGWCRPQPLYGALPTALSTPNGRGAVENVMECFFELASFEITYGNIVRIRRSGALTEDRDTVDNRVTVAGALEDSVPDITGAGRDLKLQVESGAAVWTVQRAEKI
jgi:hypothetical protein